jgi:hypothetical protein
MQIFFSWCESPISVVGKICKEYLRELFDIRYSIYKNEKHSDYFYEMQHCEGSTQWEKNFRLLQNQFIGGDTWLVLRKIVWFTYEQNGSWDNGLMLCGQREKHKGKIFITKR